MLPALALAAAHAEPPSKALRTVAGAALVAGTAGAVLADAGLVYGLTSPEPYALFLLYPPGAVGLALGTPVALGAVLAQSERVGSSPVAGWVGVGFAVASAGVVLTGALAGGLDGSRLATWGGPPLATGALICAMAQGAITQRADGVALLPDPAHGGVRLVGAF